MFKRGLLATIACCALVPVLAGASPAPAGGITVRPNAAGAGSHLLVDLDGNGAGFRRSQIPVGFAIAFEKGFALDTTAVSGTCTTGAAEKDQCPANSRLGGGSIVVSLNGGKYTAAITFFRADSDNGVVFYFKEPQSGFNGASLGTVKPTDEAPYGTVLDFPKLPLPDLPPGLDIQLQSLKLDVGAGSGSGTVRKPKPHHKHKHKHKKKRYCVKHRGKGSKRHCVKWSKHRPRKHHHRAHASAASSFITNPPACTASWTVQLRWTYKDGTKELREGGAPCAAPGQTPSGYGF
jgi:hypothetical protein